MSKVAIITGAGTGIGRATTLELLNNDYSIVAVGRRQAKLNELEDEANSSDRLITISTDVGIESEVMRLFDVTLSAFGRVDLLFNNAGIGAPAIPMEELTLSQWDQVIRTNLTGAFLCTRAAMRIMKNQTPQGGRIINNGSISAHSPRPYSAPYTASKHALTGLTKSTALDGREHQVVCCQIDVGNAATDSTALMKDGVIQPDGDRRPEPTFDVSKVAKAILYMDSLSLDANVQWMTILASQMPYTGRG
ncbi:MAG: SDR family NAD(P)-dependent oxidoreductase [Gammaproteobacteria bacterium]|nr:SDR family NAD(P)-dependent oxidoreductase [Gammaproteobacteria bacterium]